MATGNQPGACKAQDDAVASEAIEAWRKICTEISEVVEEPDSLERTVKWDSLVRKLDALVRSWPEDVRRHPVMALVRQSIEKMLLRCGDLAHQAQSLEWAREALTGKPSSPTRAPDDAQHSEDFRSVLWYGQKYTFTELQAHCVRVMWEAWKQGTPELHQGTILERANSAQDARRLDTVFRDHPAWGVMIVRARRGVYGLQEPSAKPQ